MTPRQNESRLALFPPTAEINEKSYLAIGGCDAVALAEEFGTPLYIFDEVTLRQKCAEFSDEFGRRYQDAGRFSSRKRGWGWMLFPVGN